MRYKIIGCGNADRGDDVAGLLVVRQLRELGIEAHEHSGDGLALLESWQGAEAVILIDTVVSGAAPGSLAVWDGGDVPLMDAGFQSSTHAYGVAEAIRLARVLDRMPLHLWIFGIEGREFQLATAPSEEVAAAAETLAVRLASSGCFRNQSASSP